MTVNDSNIILVVSSECIQLIYWIRFHYVATTVSTDILPNSPRKKPRPLKLQDMFAITQAYLGIFLASC